MGSSLKQQARAFPSGPLCVIAGESVREDDFVGRPAAPEETRTFFILEGETKLLYNGKGLFRFG